MSTWTMLLEENPADFRTEADPSTKRGNQAARFVVIGGAGAMGRIIVRDLVEFCLPSHEVVIADYHFEKARQYTEKLQALPSKKRKPKFSALALDVKDRA